MAAARSWFFAPMFGPGEWLVIGVILLIVFSASRMGTLGNAVGKFVYSFRRASRGSDLVDVTPTRVVSLDAPPASGAGASTSSGGGRPPGA